MILFLLLVNLISITPPVECAMSAMQFFPEEREISRHSMFLVQGYSYSQETIESFKSREVYLETPEGARVPLELQELLKGQMLLTQALFKPAEPLQPNTRYYLRFANANDRERSELLEYNYETEEREEVYWETTALKQLEPLHTSLQLEHKENEVRHYGCGPAAYAVFRVDNKTEGEIWYKTEVMAMDTGEKTSFYLSETGNSLQVGHGMCSGAFTFSKKGDYQVRFTPLTPDGQLLETTAWTPFESPHKAATNPWGI